MTFREKVLYHQIHPAKLLTDWGMTFPALYFFWVHNLIVALIVTFVPPFIASGIIIRWVNLEKYKYSTFGRYINIYMTRWMEALRLSGMLPLILGAWYHIPWLFPIGVVIVLLGWLRGMIMPQKVLRS
jgi:hypothetical protein